MLGTPVLSRPSRTRAHKQTDAKLWSDCLCQRLAIDGDVPAGSRKSANVTDSRATQWLGHTPHRPAALRVVHGRITADIGKTGCASRPFLFTPQQAGTSGAGRVSGASDRQEALPMSEPAKVFEDRETPGQYRVEWFDDDGGGKVELFSGPTARRDALRYAMRTYGHFREVQLEPYPTEPK
jgi:hypothetical protein